MFYLLDSINFLYLEINDESFLLFFYPIFAGRSRSMSKFIYFVPYFLISSLKNPQSVQPSICRQASGKNFLKQKYS